MTARPNQPRTLRRSLIAGLAWAALSLVSAAAHADAVPPPPTDCPAGTRGDSCHGGEYCAPARCSDDPDCSGSDTCQDLELCIGQVDCAGGWDPDAGPYYQDTVEGSCAGGAACVRGTCETVQVCAPPGGTGAGTAGPGSQVVEQGCGCRVLARSFPPGGAGFGALAVLLLLGARRRRS